MKHSIKILLIASIVFLCNSCVRSPEQILHKQFNISLEGFDYSVEKFNEQWNPNGDGYTLIIFKFNNLTSKNLDYFRSLKPKQLPILKQKIIQIAPNSIPKNYFFSNKGYYLYEYETNDTRTFKIIIIDINSKKAILYYQIM